MELGPMENFVYLVTDLKTNHAAVIDPAWDTKKIIQNAQSKDIKITDILLTHSHHDHINGVEDILNLSDPRLHILKDEADFGEINLGKPALHYGGDTLKIGSTEITILHTPGHTPGSACYLINNIDIITGDTLFVFGCGRCDLQGGDPEQMFATLKKMKTELDPDTVIHPGHNYASKDTSNFGEQISGNPFLHFHSCDDFVEYRMHTHDKTRHTPYHPITAKELLK
ncbi:MAG: MBL fold metallo-hydrolase [Gammaproteobacteria bacterium]|nr:MBL fold metallo-hydrolase [Gammaproteobacteria bacterium]